MAAVMSESSAFKSQSPSGHGHELLETWAMWMRGGGPGGGASWNVKERLDPPHEDDAPTEVMQVDRIVARIGVEYNPAYRRMLKHFYIGMEHPWQIAGLMGYTEGFVWMSLRACADLVGRMYEDL